MDLIVIGGGCYGSYHARQLLKAQRRGKIAARRLLIIDRNPSCPALAEFAGEPLVEVVRADWSAFLNAHLADLDPDTDDRIVPAPFAPHLFFDWLLGALQTDVPEATVARRPCELAFGLPYEHSDSIGNRFISAAGWICPATCIEPARCPAIRAERDWELGEIVRDGVARSAEHFTGVELFTCRHYAFGIGTIPAADLVRARLGLGTALRRDDSSALRVVVGTVSACHGVLGELAAQSPRRNVASTGR
jgi:hypothetical protein